MCGDRCIYMVTTSTAGFMETSRPITTSGLSDRIEKAKRGKGKDARIMGGRHVDLITNFNGPISPSLVVSIARGQLSKVHSSCVSHSPLTLH